MLIVLMSLYSMIRVVKSENIPSSLITSTSYDGEDVKQQLLDDHSGKCYLCERKLITDFQIEHLDPSASRQDWQNLFLACGYCNNKKGNRFTNILNPAINNVEDMIEHYIDCSSKKALFISAIDECTVRLLNSIFNGIGVMRKIKEERFFEYAMVQISNFKIVLEHYAFDKSPENRQAVKDLISNDQEFLGFKYWIIKRNDDLAAEFAGDIVWNKQ